MNIINKQLDRVTMISIRQPLLLPLLHELMVELDKKQDLVLDVREKVIFSNKIKHIRSSEAEVEWECFAWLAIRSVPLWET